MEIKIRQNVFETNSSSTHGMIIAKEDKDLRFPEEVTGYLDEDYGMGEYLYGSEKMNYIYTAVKSFVYYKYDSSLAEIVSYEHANDKIVALLKKYSNGFPSEPNDEIIKEILEISEDTGCLSEDSRGIEESWNCYKNFLKIFEERNIKGKFQIRFGNDNFHAYGRRQVDFKESKLTEVQKFPNIEFFKKGDMKDNSDFSIDHGYELLDFIREICKPEFRSDLERFIFSEKSIIVLRSDEDCHLPLDYDYYYYEKGN